MNCNLNVKTSWHVNPRTSLLDSRKNNLSDFVLLFLDERIEKWIKGRKKNYGIQTVLFSSTNCDEELATLSSVLEKKIVVIVACCWDDRRVIRTLKLLCNELHDRTCAISLLLNTGYDIRKGIENTADQELINSFAFSIVFYSTISLETDLGLENHCNICSPLIEVESMAHEFIVESTSKDVTLASYTSRS